MVDLFTLKRNPSNFKRVQLKQSIDCYHFAETLFEDDLDIFESFFIVLLDHSLHTIGYAKISQGGVSSTCVDLKLIALYAVKSLASNVLLIHNHPSGNLKPSEPDKIITRKAKEVLNNLDIKLFEHIIISKQGYFSFSDEALIY